nr:MAG TPA: hypothetical protein [Caudoviricetes sp.]
MASRLWTRTPMPSPCRKPISIRPPQPTWSNPTRRSSRSPPI